MKSKDILVTSFLLVVTIFIFEFTNLDMQIQKFFYNFETKEWLISKDNKLLNLIFYSGFKKFYIIFASFLAVLLLFVNKIKYLASYKKELIIVVLSLVLVPCLAILKNFTNMPCPFNVVDFGGTYHKIELFAFYPENFFVEKLKCYPAGHATMGFALMSLYFLFKDFKNKILGLTFGILAGVLTGAYKILIGDHFVSHTLVTMLASWLIIVLIAKIVNLKS